MRYKFIKLAAAKENVTIDINDINDKFIFYVNLFAKLFDGWYKWYNRFDLFINLFSKLIEITINLLYNIMWQADINDIISC